MLMNLNKFDIVYLIVHLFHYNILILIIEYRISNQEISSHCLSNLPSTHLRYCILLTNFSRIPVILLALTESIVVCSAAANITISEVCAWSFVPLYFIKSFLFQFQQKKFTFVAHCSIFTSSKMWLYQSVDPRSALEGLPLELCQFHTQGSMRFSDADCTPLTYLHYPGCYSICSCPLSSTSTLKTSPFSASRKTIPPFQSFSKFSVKPSQRILKYSDVFIQIS